MRFASKSGGTTGLAIKVARNEDHLLRLLFARAYWRIRSATWLPSVVRPPNPAESVVGNRQELARAWDNAWSRALDWSVNAESRDTIIHSLSESALREKLISLLPAAWPPELSGQAFPEADFTEWRSSLDASGGDAHPSPPLSATQATISSAWRGGLRVIVVLPVQGLFDDRVGRHGIVMSEESFVKSGTLRAALARFRGDGAAEGGY